MASAEHMATTTLLPVGAQDPPASLTTESVSESTGTASPSTASPTAAIVAAAAPKASASNSAPQLPPSLDSVQHWPVPHVMVFISGTKIACGRGTIAEIGKHAFMVWLYRAYFWVSSHQNARFKEEYHYDRSFPKRHHLLATFYHVEGQDDVGPVEISGLGWGEMIMNVIKLELVPVAA